MNFPINCSYLGFRFWFFIAALICVSPMHASAFGYVDKDHYLYPIMIDIRYHKYDEAMAKLDSNLDNKCNTYSEFCSHFNPMMKVIFWMR